MRINDVIFNDGLFVLVQVNAVLLGDSAQHPSLVLCQIAQFLMNIFNSLIIFFLNPLLLDLFLLLLFVDELAVAFLFSCLILLLHFIVLLLNKLLALLFIHVLLQLAILHVVLLTNSQFVLFFF